MLDILNQPNQITQPRQVKVNAVSRIHASTLTAPRPRALPTYARASRGLSAMERLARR